MRGKSKHPLPAPSSLSSAPSIHAPHLACNMAHERGCKEGERACKHSLHALSPACCMAPTCAHPHHVCGGALFSPPSACGVRATLPLCANGECRAAPKRYTPPTFRHCPRSVRQNNKHRTCRSSPFPPPFHAQAGASSPQQAWKAAACHNPRSCTQAEHMNGGGGMPPSPTPICARRAWGVDHRESQRCVPPPSPFGPLPTRTRAIGGAARMGMGMQVARHPLILRAGVNGVHTGMPPPLCFHARAATCEGGGGAPKQSNAPPALRVRMTPRASHVHSPACPTLRMPCARRPTCGAMCAGWHVKGGAREGRARGTHAQGHVHPPFPARACHQGGYTEGTRVGWWGGNREAHTI